MTSSLQVSNTDLYFFQIAQYDPEFQCPSGHHYVQLTSRTFLNTFKLPSLESSSPSVVSVEPSAGLLIDTAISKIQEEELLFDSRMYHKFPTICSINLQ